MFKPKEENRKTWSKKISPLMRLSGREKLLFVKYLAVLIQAGVPLEKALMTIHNQTSSLVMHRVLHILLDDVVSGEFLSTGLKKMPWIFDNLFISLVVVGENSGTLPSALFRIGEHMEKTRELKAKVRAAFVYPGIVVVGTVIVATYLVFVLLPQLIPLFTSLNVELPLATRAVIAVTEFLLAYGAWVALAIVAMFAAFFLALRFEPFRYLFHQTVLRIPIFGKLIKQVQVSQFSGVLSILLASGTSIVEAFNITGEALDNLVYRAALQKVAASVQEGENISTYLAQHHALFSPFVTQMIGVGEETGKLDESFAFVATFTERELDDTTKTLASVLEPALLVAVGGLVGFIAIAVITPIYQLTTGISR